MREGEGKEVVEVVLEGEGREKKKEKEVVVVEEKRKEGGER